MAKTREKERERQELTPADVGDLPHAATSSLMVPPPAALVSAPMSEAAQAFLDEIKGPREEVHNIPLISIDHREAQFQLPSGELVETVAGYPIYFFQTRRFYEKPPVPGLTKGAPPDCWSADMVEPHTSSLKIQHPTCAGCPRDAWGTGRDGRSKACGAYTWVFLLNPQFGQPPIAAVMMPPSSIRTMMGTRFEGGYFAKCRAKHRVYEIVWTTLTLQQQGDQVIYCTVEPLMGPACSDVAMVKQLASLRNTWHTAMESLRGKTVTVEQE